MRSRLLSLGFAPGLAVATTSSFIAALGCPPGGWAPGHWIGWVPLLVMVRRPCVTLRQAFWLGLAGAMGVGLGGFPWIAEMLVKFAGVPWPVGCFGLLCVSLWMAIPYALWCVGLRFGPLHGWLSYVWALGLFVGIHDLWPNLFPYTPVLGWAEHPEWLQLAEIGGAPILEIAMFATALLLADAVMAERPLQAARNLALALAIPLALHLHGSWRMQALDAEAEGAPSLLVALVQPNVPVGRVPARVKLARLTGTSAQAERAGADLVVWPEAGTYPYRVRRPFRHDSELLAGRVLVHHRSDTIFGANSREPDDRYGRNATYHLSADGTVQGHYDKVNLVPFGEAIPIIPPHWITDRIRYIGHHVAGDAPARFLVAPREDDGTRYAIGPLICYEDIIPDFVREVAAQPGGIDLFVNQTIDAWYGDTAEPWEHLALAQIRSVEHRIPLVRSVSTGVTSVVDQSGRLVSHIPLRPVTDETLGEYPPEILIERIALPRNTERDPTFYARFGWLLPHLGQLLALGLGIAFARGALGAEGLATLRAMGRAQQGADGGKAGGGADGEQR